MCDKLVLVPYGTLALTNFEVNFGLEPRERTQASIIGISVIILTQEPNADRGGPRRKALLHNFEN